MNNVVSSLSGLVAVVSVSMFILLFSCNGTTPSGSVGGSWTVTETSLIDPDGNVYSTIMIGSQIWTVENLMTTKYNDGSPIFSDTSAAAWINSTTPEYCFYNNTTDPDSIRKYGALYNWYVVSPANPGKIAPTGWHVPTDADWITLENYLVINGYNWDGTTDTTQNDKIAKSLAATTDWFTSAITGTIGCDLTKNNTGGFSGLPAGLRSGYDRFDSYEGRSYGAYWWSATEIDSNAARYRVLSSNDEGLNRGINFKGYGYSVRLIRN